MSKTKDINKHHAHLTQQSHPMAVDKVEVVLDNIFNRAERRLRD